MSSTPRSANPRVSDQVKVNGVGPSPAPRLGLIETTAVVKICKIDVVTGLHIAEELAWKDKAEEDVDRQHEDKVGIAFAKRRPPPPDPVLQSPILRLRDAKKIDAEAKKPFRIHMVDADVGHSPCVFQRFRLAQMRTDLAHDGFDPRVKIDGCKGATPPFGDLSFGFQKLARGPPAHRLLFLALLEDYRSEEHTS